MKRIAILLLCLLLLAGLYGLQAEEKPEPAKPDQQEQDQQVQQKEKEKEESIDQENKNTSKGVILHELVKSAVSVKKGNYVTLRQKWLEIAKESKDDLEKTLKEIDNWQDRVITQAWMKWLEHPEICGRLWNYKPPSDFSRNPYPRMAQRAYETFGKEGEIGLSIAMELLFKKEEIHYGGLSKLLSDKKPELAFEVLLEFALHRRHHRLDDDLASFGADISQKLVTSLGNADRRCLDTIIFAIGHLKYKPAMPTLGKILLDEQDKNYTSVDIGIAIAYAMEEITGETFWGHGRAVCTIVTDRKRIQDVRAWWKDVGSLKKWDAESQDTTPQEKENNTPKEK